MKPYIYLLGAFVSLLLFCHGLLIHFLQKDVINIRNRVANLEQPVKILQPIYISTYGTN